MCEFARGHQVRIDLLLAGALLGWPTRIGGRTGERASERAGGRASKQASERPASPSERGTVECAPRALCEVRSLSTQRACIQWPARTCAVSPHTGGQRLCVLGERLTLAAALCGRPLSAMGAPVERWSRLGSFCVLLASVGPRARQSTESAGRPTSGERRAANGDKHIVGA